jgi:hypothetical protein
MAMSHGGRGTLVTGGAGGGVLQHQRRGEKVRRMPVTRHDAWRTRLTEGAEGRRQQWLGLPVARR